MINKNDGNAMVEEVRSWSIGFLVNWVLGQGDGCTEFKKKLLFISVLKQT